MRISSCATETVCCAIPPGFDPTKEPLWFVDPVNGNDGNLGTIEACPLETLAEFTRRVTRAIYSPSFGPYEIVLLGDVPKTDSFQWAPSLVSTEGPITFDPRGGLTRPIVRIRGRSKRVESFTLASVTGPVLDPNDPLLLTRTSGIFVLGEMIEVVTSGSAIAGTRVPVEDVSNGGLTAAVPINPFLLAGGGPPTAGDTFATIALTALNVPLEGAGLPSGAVTQAIDVRISSVADGGPGPYVVQGSALELIGSSVNEIVMPDSSTASEVRLTPQETLTSPVHASHMWKDTLTQAYLFGGTLTAIAASFTNVVLNVAPASAGGLVSYFAEFWSSPVRPTGDAPALMIYCRAFEWPSFVPPAFDFLSPDVGAALVMRFGVALVTALTGRSTQPGTVGVNDSEASRILLEYPALLLPTVTGALQDILFEAGADVPHTFVNGIPTAGAPLTSWSDFITIFLGHAFSLERATLMMLRNP